MKIEFASTKLEKLLFLDRDLIKHFGKERAKIIRRRLEDLKNVECMADMFTVSGRFHPLTGNRIGQFALHVTPNFRIIIAPNENPLPLTFDSGIDLEQIRNAIILEIAEDYH